MELYEHVLVDAIATMLLLMIMGGTVFIAAIAKFLYEETKRGKQK
jgi:hypothetical protein